MVPTISKWPSSSVPAVEGQWRSASKTLAPQGFAVSKSVETANVRKQGWLCELELDYRHRGWDRHYHVDVLAALPEGGARL